MSLARTETELQLEDFNQGLAQIIELLTELLACVRAIEARRG